jgi:hypothetical protein
MGISFFPHRGRKPEAGDSDATLAAPRPSRIRSNSHDPPRARVLLGVGSMRAQTLVLLLTLFLASCAEGTRRFSTRPIVWVDDDARAFSPAPAEAFRPYFWDAMDNMIFRPSAEAFRFEPGREAVDVNALDEVPSSSWFVNRIGRREMAPDEVARGACESMEIDPPGPWRVFSGKPDGATPGFLFEDASGQRYVLKVDRARQPEQSTAAHTVVAALFHAAGYHVPCNRVVSFTRDTIVLDEDATVDVAGGEEPMTERDIETVLAFARHTPDGRLRAVLSRFVDGRPIGPWSYRGVREDDPNDVVAHEDRRELRGMFVLSAWVNHWDSRDHNTISAWMERGDGGFVRHYVLDFDECLGMIEGGELRSRRFGHSQWLDVQHIVEDMAGMGIVQRPWDADARGPAGNVLGYFDVEGFEPEQWRPDYWNGAFERRTERDAAWMARIIARFSLEHIEALARVGRYSDPMVERELVRVLAGRQRAILERYLTRLSPLADPTVRGRTVCMRDLAVSSHLRWPQDRVYEAWLHAGESFERRDELVVRRAAEDMLCVDLPARAPAEYLVLDLVARTHGGDQPGPARLHFSMGGGRPLLVGLERPAGQSAP